MENKAVPATDPVGLDHMIQNNSINIHCTSSTDEIIRTYNRKGFYKICLFTGEAMIEYADRGIHIKGSSLFFGTPHIPYSWENIHKEKAYSAIFTEEFLKTNNNSESLQQSPLFKIGGTPVFHLTEMQSKPIVEIFERMIAAYHTDYIYKNDLTRNYINLIIHEALQLHPPENVSQPKRAAERVAAMFLELLERQFPVESPANPLKLKTANDFGQALAIHVNHLNHAVKGVTGKSTTSHISERIVTEAKTLLRHTNWSIAEVGYALGFEYPTYFNNYIKRLTGVTPTKFR